MAENELNELAELLRELEQTLLTLKVTEGLERRRLLLRKMSRLFAEIERNPSLQNESSLSIVDLRLGLMTMIIYQSAPRSCSGHGVAI
jgi:hypothetical protein